MFARGALPRGRAPSGVQGPASPAAAATQLITAEETKQRSTALKSSRDHSLTHASRYAAGHGTRHTAHSRDSRTGTDSDGVRLCVHVCAHTTQHRLRQSPPGAHITTLRGERREVDQLPPRRPAAWTQLVPLFAGTVTRSNACGRDHHTLATERQGGALPGAGSATVATRALADAGSERWRRCRQLTPAGIRGRTKCRASAGGGCSRGARDATADLTDGLR